VSRRGRAAKAPGEWWGRVSIEVQAGAECSRQQQRWGRESGRHGGGAKGQLCSIAWKSAQGKCFRGPCSKVPPCRHHAATSVVKRGRRFTSCADAGHSNKPPTSSCRYRRRLLSVVSRTQRRYRCIVAAVAAVSASLRRVSSVAVSHAKKMFRRSSRRHHRFHTTTRAYFTRRRRPPTARAAAVPSLIAALSFFRRHQSPTVTFVCRACRHVPAIKPPKHVAFDAQRESHHAILTTRRRQFACRRRRCPQMFSVARAIPPDRLQPLSIFRYSSFAIAPHTTPSRRQPTAAAKLPSMRHTGQEYRLQAPDATAPVVPHIATMPLFAVVATLLPPSSFAYARGHRLLQQPSARQISAHDILPKFVAINYRHLRVRYSVT